MPYPFELKKVYSFDVYPSQLLGNDFQNVTVLSILDFDTALQFMDVPALHTNVFPTLPAGTPDDPAAYDYVKIKTASGQNTILGIPWINQATIALVESRKMTIVIDGVSAADVDRARNALAQNGFNQIAISLN